MSARLAPQPAKIHPAAFVAPSAVVVGDVTLAAGASLWFGVVARGDSAPIVVGADTNVQDGCILHADEGQPCRLGARVSLGHGAVVHAAEVEDEVLIGIRATVLNGARIGRGSVVAAGAVVTPGTVVPPGSMVMGMPARVVRPANDDDRALIQRTSEHYVAAAREYRERYGSSRPLGAGLPGVPDGTAPAANPDAVRLLRGLAVFEGLSEAELARVAAVCRKQSFKRGEVITTQGAFESETFVVRVGLVEVSVAEGSEQPPTAATTLLSLGRGQVVGEMALVDHGPRSATVRCQSDDCDVMVIDRDAFEALCAADHHIGLVVYRNLAADLSFKLRHRHLTRR
jgi:carbonic anhydrase/acetyltransferase-like protein (isoleucine patch superfamily)